MCHCRTLIHAGPIELKATRSTTRQRHKERRYQKDGMFSNLDNFATSQLSGLICNSANE